MRVLIFVALVMMAYVAVASPFCQPHSTYSASTYDVYGGGTCFCNNNGSIAYCRTIHKGVNFSFTQTSDNKRGDLAMCLSNDTCFNVPHRTDLVNSRCYIYIQPSDCTAEHDGMIFNFIRDSFPGAVDGTVTINGTTYEILPPLLNGQILHYL